MNKDPKRNPNCKVCNGYGVYQVERKIPTKNLKEILALDTKACHCKRPKGK